ncbi:hypothetical protein IZ6_12260 [Terrihabitans soli]|uniref:Uncharacterized protein n=1 Tax=Terrihabitans soli TaxID=708113 RepID=A0A6S6QTU4_9HYPH|nr:hypothetical protein [Terrihabitans soli]BCJ90491.1 hypothetical protein IZ6_12260 [Terrihabitans soli]
MKSWVFTALVCAGIVIVSLSGACAGERKIKVTNGSSSIIVELYASPPELGDYQANILGGATKIAPGASASVTFEDGGACAFDFQAVTGDEDMFTARNVDICASPDVKLPQ